MNRIIFRLQGKLYHGIIKVSRIEMKEITLSNLCRVYYSENKNQFKQEEKKWK